ncbi:hypothetical protein QNO07_16565 [Streptomyces sp. 549]|uniref:hypothetical protein n=1 Tax=Streptomyces sp. 549 TaxID=3049076 RepID=UPI0024C374FC|nr:hypothetical protein [Streptomyces sp. 549]MDK1475011.1 hypothetical protein [Streptomyces sp. 549]
MYMNSAPHLRIEDRPEFERALDEALRSARERPELADAQQHLNSEQLRTMALSASAAITACAAAEYQEFIRLREKLRHPAPSTTPSDGTGEDGITPRGGVSLGIAGGIADTGGAGLFAVVTVLAPVLAGAAAVIFLAVGYALHMLSPEPALAEPMRNVGWVFAVITAGGILIATIGLLLTALRNSASATQEPDSGTDTGPLAEEVALARTVWRQALIERGIVPFLREALTDPPDRLPEPTPAPPTGPGHQSGSRTPRLGYSHPGFTSPAGEASQKGTSSPRFSSPDFSSPDFGGPDHKPE